MNAKSTDTPGVPFPPPLIFAAGILGGYLLDRVVDARFPGFLPSRLLGVAIIVVGIVLAVWSIVEFKRFKTSPEPWHPASHLLVTGPFRYSRNPIYVAMAALQAGIGFYQNSPWIVAFVPAVLWAVWMIVIRKEEAYLERKFGDEYRRYKEGVGRWIG